MYNIRHSEMWKSYAATAIIRPFHRISGRHGSRGPRHNFRRVDTICQIAGLMPPQMANLRANGRAIYRSGKGYAMNSRNSRLRGSGYTAGVERPSKDRAISARGVAGLLLTLVLPPVGLLFLWRQGVFRTRGRLLLTGLATLEMTALVVLLTPHQELTPRMPVPAAPAQVTAAPPEELLTALYNSEELVYQNKLEQVKAAGGTERDLMTEEEKLELANDETEAIYATVVYSVYGSEAVYYHATKVCRTQTNGRELTVRDALREGLQPCPNCNPPSVDS